jgi:hypothetical protein
MQMAEHAGHDEIRAWCYETREWASLVDGDHPEALRLSLRAQEIDRLQARCASQGLIGCTGT